MHQFKKILTTLLCLLININIHAVNISPSGQGEVLIFPYYTVNNELNTLYSVVNTTSQAKAVRIRFLEGEAGRVVFLINVYLAPYDVWNGVLVPITSNQPGHAGEPSVTHVTADNSCAPFLNKSGTEFLPDQLELDGGNNNMQRARDGHIEIIEMGVVTGNSAAAISHSFSIPNNCDSIEEAWQEGGYWDADSAVDINSPSGGLIGSGQIINVAEGIAFSYDAEALENFWSGMGTHGAPGSLKPDLADAHPTSAVLLNNEVFTSQWETGFEAVSAVLMKTRVFNEFDLSPGNLSQSEWVVTFPTKSYHANDLPIVRPFEKLWDSATACEEFSARIYDREEQESTFNASNVSPTPVGVNPSLCFQTNVIQFIGNDEVPEIESKVMGADNLVSVFNFNSDFATDAGWVVVDFFGSNQYMSPVTGISYQGMPVIGFQVSQFTNNDAQPGLIAQYGRLSKHKSKVLNF